MKSNKQISEIDQRYLRFHVYQSVMKSSRKYVNEFLHMRKGSAAKASAATFTDFIDPLMGAILMLKQLTIQSITTSQTYTCAIDILKIKILPGMRGK